jgi:hypothetical protein
LELDEHGDGLTVREMVTLLNDPNNAERFPAMREVVSEVATSRGAIDQRRLGYAFRKYRGRIANGWTDSRRTEPNWRAMLEGTIQQLQGMQGMQGMFSRILYAEVCVSHT